MKVFELSGATGEGAQAVLDACARVLFAAEDQHKVRLKSRAVAGSELSETTTALAAKKKRKPAAAAKKAPAKKKKPLTPTLSPRAGRGSSAAKVKRR